MFTSIFFVIPLLVAQGSTIWVPDDHALIQDALLAGQSGDTVVVRAGTYYEYELNFGGKDIVMTSEDGAEVTVIDGMSSGSVIVFNTAESPAAVLNGFTITGGTAWDGGGISIIDDPILGPSSPTIQNCIIANNVGSGGGGGMHIRGASTTLVHNCLIRDNSTTFYHGAGVVIFDSSPIFKNCTIRDNNSGGTGGGFAVWDASSNLLINDCIVFGNTPSSIDRYGSAQILAEYSLVEGGTGKWWFGSGCIDADPLFATGVLGSSYLSHIAAGQAVDSPCIDAANPTTPGFGTTRTDGMADIGIGDIGYHHQIPLPELAVNNLVAGQTAVVTLSNCTPNASVIFAWSRMGGGPTSGPFGDIHLSPPYHIYPLTSDAGGKASLSSPVPPSTFGIQIWFHGADIIKQSMTNPVTQIIG